MEGAIFQMSQCTDGILFYGIAYGDRDDISKVAADCEGDFEKLYAHRMGITEPTEAYSKNDQSIRKKYSDYWAETSKIIAESSCEVSMYCSIDSPMYYVCIKEAHYVVNRGDEVEIPDGLAAKIEWNQKLKDYCQLLDLPYQEPRWLLVSYWG